MTTRVSVSGLSSSGRWRVYHDVAPSPDLAVLLAEVDADPTGIFFG